MRREATAETSRAPLPRRLGAPSSLPLTLRSPFASFNRGSWASAVLRHMPTSGGRGRWQPHPYARPAIDRSRGFLVGAIPLWHTSEVERDSPRPSGMTGRVRQMLRRLFLSFLLAFGVLQGWSGRLTGVESRWLPPAKSQPPAFSERWFLTSIPGTTSIDRADWRSRAFERGAGFV